MPTINDLRQQAATIKNATQVGENTATRVGTTFETIADLLEGMGGVTNLSTIDIGSIDTLNTTGDMLVGTPNIYTITKTIGANTFKVGTLFQFANNGRYDVAQVIVSQFIVDGDGRIDTTSADQEVHIFYRLCKTMNGGSLPTPIGTWTTWTELGGSGGSGVTIDPYPTQNSGNAVSSGGVFERLQDVAPKVDISAIDDIDEYSDMLATKSPFYVVTKTLSGNVFRIGTLMEFANQGRYILYQILATDYVLNDDGTLDTTLSENGGLKLIWRMKQFSGNPPAGVTIGVWSAWSYLSGGGVQPDNEDIDLNANDQLQFANKAYDASAFSGLGRVYLRKNIVELNLTDKYFDGFVNNVLVQNVGTSSTPDEICFDTTRKMFVARVGLSWYLDWSSDEDYNPITGDVNWNYNGNFYRWNGKELAQWDKTINQLTQAMVNTANTIYHIQYDYDLNGQTITLPAGCVLEFDGGSLRNGTLVGDGTQIKAGLTCILNNVDINGSWDIIEAYPEWLGALCDGENDDAIAINKLLGFNTGFRPLRIVFSNKEYTVGESIILSNGANISLEGTGKNVLKKPQGNYKDMILAGKVKNLLIRNLTFEGSYTDWSIVIPESEWAEKAFNCCLRAASETTNAIFDNNIVQNFNYGIFIGGAYEDDKPRPCDNDYYTEHITITNSKFELIKAAAIDTFNQYGLLISNNYIKNCGQSAYAISIEPSEARANMTSDPFSSDSIKDSYALADGVSITDNKFYIDSISCLGCIKCFSGTIKVNICNNFIAGDIEAGIEIISPVMLSIDNNVIQNVSAGIYISGYSGIVMITNNKLIDCQAVTFSVQKSQDGKHEFAYIVGNYFGLSDNTSSTVSNFTTLKYDNIKMCNNTFYNVFKNASQYKRQAAVCLEYTITNAEIYNNILLKTNDDPVPYFIYISKNTDFISNNIKMYDNISLQPLTNAQVTSLPSAYGTSSVRPTNKKLDKIGFRYFDTTLKKQIFLSAIANDRSFTWADEDGIDLTGVTAIRGTTAVRTAMTLTAANAGLRYYDTTLKKYVLWNGTTWTNLDGTALA